jgi:hypothetical protein
VTANTDLCLSLPSCSHNGCCYCCCCPIWLINQLAVHDALHRFVACLPGCRPMLVAAGRWSLQLEHTPLIVWMRVKADRISSGVLLACQAVLLA